MIQRRHREEFAGMPSENDGAEKQSQARHTGPFGPRREEWAVMGSSVGWRRPGPAGGTGQAVQKSS